MYQLWQNLPYELKERAQWCVAGTTKQPLTVDTKGALHAASVTAPSTWMTYELASAVGDFHKMDVGYVLHESDPFSCIDFDIKDDTTREEWDFANKAIHTFDSYTERSRSGRGFHTWVKGKIGRGVRKSGIEIYSQERFIICTGNIVLHKPIEERESALFSLAKWLKPTINGHLVEL